jgi:peptide subunit release factor 1 (eRF1)
MRKAVSSGVQEARRLVAYRGKAPVISLYLDLDPEQFATAPARASQIRSLLDAAAKEIESEKHDRSHEQRAGLRADVERIGSFLSSPEAPFKGARGLAVFSSAGGALFETIKLARPVPGQVVIGDTPYVSPMLEAVETVRWLVALVNRRSARVLAGAPDQLSERARLDDGVHGKHEQGGWSQANYERSIEDDVEQHLKRIAEIVNHRWREERFDRVAIGGPVETVPRFEELLAEEVRRQLAPGRVEVDLSSVSEAQVREAVEKLVAEDQKRAERQLLDRLENGIGAGGRATGGPEATLAALNERRVKTLLLEPGFDLRGKRCPSCGLLLLDGDDACPADGSPLEEVDHLREAVVEAALTQDAGVVVVRSYPDLGPHRGIAALLRF